MAQKTLTIRPGIMVALKTSVEGGVRYDRKEISRTTDGSLEKWETTRICLDPNDYQAAVEARALAGALVRRVCSRSSFGLLCPGTVEKEKELDDAIATAQSLADKHNAASSLTKVRIFVLKGRVASDDEQAARAIASDIGELISAMAEAVTKMDPVAIRKAATDAKQMLQVLSEDKQKQAAAAIEAARKAARDIVKRVQNGGEDAAKVLDDLAKETGSIQAARLAFIDVAQGSSDEPAATPELPAVQVQRVAELDMGTDAPAAPASSGGVTIAVDARQAEADLAKSGAAALLAQDAAAALAENDENADEPAETTSSSAGARSPVVCDLTQKKETPEQARARVTKALAALAAGLQGNKISIEISPSGAIAFKGWQASERGGLSDTCAYRLMQQKHGFALTRALAAAELKSGRKVSIGQISAGTHSHDGGKTWHPGH